MLRAFIRAAADQPRLHTPLPQLAKRIGRRENAFRFSKPPHVEKRCDGWSPGEIEGQRLRRMGKLRYPVRLTLDSLGFNSGFLQLLFFVA